MYDSAVLRDLLILTKDGEWGKGEPSHDLLEMLVIRGADFNEARFCDLKDIPVRFIPKHIAERKQLQPEDILIETAGGTRDQPTGRTVFLKPRLFRNSSTPITCASFSRFLRIDKSRAFPEYVFWYLQHLYKSGQMEQHQVQHTGVARFQYTKFAESTVISLPPLHEQRAIARILGTLDDKIELNRRMNETLESIARAIFKSWFVDFDPVQAKAEGREPAGMDAETAALFPDSFEETVLGKVPKGWKVAKIGDVVKVVGGSTPRTENPEFWSGTINFATPKDLASLTSPFLLKTERRITDAGLEQISSGLLPKGTVLLSSRAPIGYLAITEIPVAVNQGFIAMICNEEVTNYYLLEWIRENMDLIIGNANGTTFLEISKKNFRPIIALIPPQNILRIFAIMVESIYELIICNLRQSKLISNILDGLLPKLLSGDVSVNDWMNFKYI